MKWTEKEKEAAKFLKSEGYSWIARDKKGTFAVSVEKPEKHVEQGLWGDDETMLYSNGDKTLFSSIVWTDEVPISIDEIIKEI